MEFDEDDGNGEYNYEPPECEYCSGVATEETNDGILLCESCWDDYVDGFIRD